MTATGTLRRHLDERGIGYGVLGDYMTMIISERMSWTIRDAYDGTMTIESSRHFTPDEIIAIVDRSTKMSVVVDGDGVGRATCCSCGRTVGQYYAYCPWCGREFNEKETSHVESF